MYTRGEMIVTSILGTIAVIFVAVFCAFMLYLMGWGIGLYEVSCTIESSQPKCVRAGWGEHNDVVLKDERRTPKTD